MNASPTPFFMSKPPTILDIARELSVHKSTVSLALSGKGNVSAATRERIVSQAKQMGYEPDLLAQRLARGFHHSLVCLFSGGLDVGLTTEKVLLIQKALSERGLDVPLYTCAAADAGDAQLSQVRQLCRQRPRAIVCAANQADERIYAELADYQRVGGIVVSYDSPISLACDQVVFDREDNAYQAARHLLEKGHRKIGLGLSRLEGIAAGTESDPEVPRRRGFQRALAEFGIEARPDWIFHNSTYEKGGAEMARQFLRLGDRPTALSIVNDYVALAFMVDVMRAGLAVPGDISIVSHDNQPIAAYCPVPLTSVTHPAQAIVGRVVEMLIERIDGIIASETPARTVVLRGELVRRESVAPPR
jgi:LacI family repressor for deo operon, udp, cdd, tsx, nupC, and nupG